MQIQKPTAILALATEEVNSSVSLASGTFQAVLVPSYQHWTKQMWLLLSWAASYSPTEDVPNLPFTHLPFLLVVNLAQPLYKDGKHQPTLL